jgi:hypothetical protein
VRRRLFNLAAVVSLVLLVSVGVLWPRSYWQIDQVWWHSYVSDNGSVLIRRYWTISSGNGGLWLHVDTHTMGPAAYAANAPGIRALYPKGKAAQWESSVLTNQFQLSSFHHFLGFLHAPLSSKTPIASVRTHWWRVPYWAVALTAAILPWQWLALRRRWRLSYRRQNHLCLRCGYDLRASPDRCPECGTAAKRHAAAGID